MRLAARKHGPIEYPCIPSCNGGFAFYGSYDDDTPKSFFEISTNPRCTADVVKFECGQEHFPHIITVITEDYIIDQAAPSSLRMALLIDQVAWFSANCASWLFQGLPLSFHERTMD